MIARRIRTSRAALENPQKPIGVFLLAGPSGVGKTRRRSRRGSALRWRANVITINMSDFKKRTRSQH